MLAATLAACGGGGSSPAAAAPAAPGQAGGTFTLNALSASPSLPASASQVTGAVLTGAIANITLGSASLKLSYTSPQ